ncbi:hypothetical protein M427DRAFT_43194 [Gonapodya prolifera JEL478]|uniref:Uncharacterized protein n=1 Tax=Gonapodya prolifera (strain JEL478) TaxID=1344416 RepID=A0A139AKF5_GONPJ|nr:hypothetical protein M427DRAFT_43194 [Gonapodya prolifera JEL478]|eukprot:KXS17257.1 hypothetical protein M427DRAFT_43194 [Gonapodya prolifera JEL478]
MYQATAMMKPKHKLAAIIAGARERGIYFEHSEADLMLTKLELPSVYYLFVDPRGYPLPSERLYNTTGLYLNGKTPQTAGRKVDLITHEQREELKRGICFGCGATPAGGIDREENDEGYTESNARPACFPCNRMKSDRTDAALQHHLKCLLWVIRNPEETSRRLSEHRDKLALDRVVHEDEINISPPRMEIDENCDTLLDGDHVRKDSRRTFFEERAKKRRTDMVISEHINIRDGDDEEMSESHSKVISESDMDDDPSNMFSASTSGGDAHAFRKRKAPSVNVGRSIRSKPVKRNLVNAVLAFKIDDIDRALKFASFDIDGYDCLFFVGKFDNWTDMSRQIGWSETQVNSLRSDVRGQGLDDNELVPADGYLAREIAFPKGTLMNSKLWTDIPENMSSRDPNKVNPEFEEFRKACLEAHPPRKREVKFQIFFDVMWSSPQDAPSISKFIISKGGKIVQSLSNFVGTS